MPAHLSANYLITYVSFDSYLQEYAKDEETLKAVYESVNAVVGILRSDEESVARPGALTR